MEDPDVTLSDDEARELFSAFHEGELSSAEARAMREKLAQDSALSAEFDAFKRMMAGLAGLAVRDSVVPEAVVPAETPSQDFREEINLLPALQQTLHERSGGKYYATKASRLVGTRPLELVAALLLAVLLAGFFAARYVSGLRVVDPPSAPMSQGASGQR
ncbi:MAG: hypothetical protein Q8Q09_01130 [Deltaproteobacteria bacterium]|nr:hypothetical protein [Deltaproteobacteria bacterium]